MSYLNWKARPESVSQLNLTSPQAGLKGVAPDSGGPFRAAGTGEKQENWVWTLQLDTQDRSELRSALSLLQKGQELRLDLPGEHLFFFKVREGEARIFLSHPEKDAWVCAVSFSASAQAQLLTGLETEEPFLLSTLLKPCHALNNAEVRIVSVRDNLTP